MAVTEREEVSDLVILLDQIQPLNYCWVVLGERERERERGQRDGEREGRAGLIYYSQTRTYNNYVHATEMFEN